METLHEYMLLTKGYEYLMAIGVLVFFVLFWIYLNRGQALLPQPVRALRIEDLQLGKRMLFHPGHTWLKQAFIGGNLVGIDDFIDRLAGNLPAIKVPATGSFVKRGEPIFALDLGSHTMNIPAPVSGKVTMINPKMYQQSYHPQLGSRKINWLIRLEPTQWDQEAVDLNTDTKAGEWLRNEVERFRRFLDKQSERPRIAAVALADGGDPVVGVLQLLDREGLQQFESEFLAN